MNKEIFRFSSDVIEISEEDKPYLQMVNRVCYYDAPNANGVILPSDTAEQFAATLVEMPVYAKCRVNEKGEPTFGSHEISLDENGEIFFDTVPIGVHTSVEVKEDTVTVGGVSQTLPCLFATQKIWTRNTNAVAAIKRLFSEGKLHNSWELHNNSYTYADGLKTITDYEFVGNTMLGYEYADPAYGESAKVLSISEAELMVAEALSRDMIENEEMEGDHLNLDSNMNIAGSETENPAAVNTDPTPVAEEPVAGAEENPQAAEPAADPVNEEPNGEASEGGHPAPDPQQEPEVSALTTYDLYTRIADAARDLVGSWCYVAFIFPEDHIALLKTESTQDELTYMQVSYAVADDNTVTLSDLSEITLVISVAEINSKVAELNDAIASLNEQLVQAQNEIDALTPYREAAEKAERDQKKAALRAYAENSRQFTEDELDGEIGELIENLDEAAVKAAISDRVVASQNDNTASASKPKLSTAAIADAGDITAEAILRDFFAKH